MHSELSSSKAERREKEIFDKSSIVMDVI